MFVLALAAAVLAGGTARADIETYSATLSGDQEVPPVATAASGNAAIVVDTDTYEATWTLAFSGLSSAQVGAHFHNAPAGSNGGVVFALPLGSPVNGAWAMDATSYAMLSGGNIYVNVHTENFPGGEIRGQFTLTGTVPSAESSFSAVKALYR